MKKKVLAVAMIVMVLLVNMVNAFALTNENDIKNIEEIPVNSAVEITGDNICRLDSDDADGVNDSDLPEAPVLMRSLMRVYPGTEFAVNTYGYPIAGFGSGIPGWIQRLPADKQWDTMADTETVKLGSGTATKLDSRVSMDGSGRINFNRVANQVINYGNIVRYQNNNAGYIGERAITSTTTISMVSDSRSDKYLGEQTCTAVVPGIEPSTGWNGLSFVSMYPRQFDVGGGVESRRSKPLNSFRADVEIRYKDTGEIVNMPFDITVLDLDIFQNAFNVPEAVHIGSGLATFKTYDRTQLRYSNVNLVSGCSYGFIGSPNNNAVSGNDSIFLRGGHLKTYNGKFTIGFTECNCSTFLNVRSPLFSEKPPKGKLTLKKTVESDQELVKMCPSQYDLSGAEYTVYTNSNCTNAAGTLKTSTQKKDSAGNLFAESNTLELSPATYYVKETKAPKGYKKNNKIYSVTVNKGGNVTLNVSDRPMFDPLSLTLKKHIPEGLPNTEKYLEGAEYTVKYYPDYYDNESSLRGKIPLRTWVFRTDSDGMFIIDTPWHVGGDELFQQEDGTVVGLYGTYTFEETKAPSGFLKNSGITIRQIKQGIAPPHIDTENHGDANNVAAEKPDNNLNRKITAVKKISRDNVYSPYGIPTAIFKLEGTDLYGNKTIYHKAITLDSSKLSGDYYIGEVNFDHLPAGNYVLSEIKTSRYNMKDIIADTSNSVRNGDNVNIELINSVSGKATFENEILRWNDYSDMECIVNRF